MIWLFIIIWIIFSIISYFLFLDYFKNDPNKKIMSFAYCVLGPISLISIPIAKYLNGN